LVAAHGRKPSRKRSVALDPVAHRGRVDVQQREEVDSGARPGVSSMDAAEIKALHAR
jgi:hypothetical protein